MSTTDFRDALIPKPLQTDKQHGRFYHLDLSVLEDEELMDELHYLQPLLWGLDSKHWLRERVGMIEAEIMKRRGNSRYKPSRKQIPKLAKGVDL